MNEAIMLEEADISTAPENETEELENDLRTELMLVANDLEGFGSRVRVVLPSLGDNQEIQKIKTELGEATLKVEEWLHVQRAGELRRIFDGLNAKDLGSKEAAVKYLDGLDATFQKLVSTFTEAVEKLESSSDANKDHYRVAVTEIKSIVSSLNTEVLRKFNRNFPDYQEKLEALKVS